MTPDPTSPRIVLVAAVADNGVIGRDGGLPWRMPSDLKRFRAITMNRPMVMGRRTFESIGRPLDGRSTIVVTRRGDYEAPAGVIVAASLDEALVKAAADAAARGVDAIAVIGGADIFAMAMRSAEELAITHIHAHPKGDVLFPSISEKDWQAVLREPLPQSSEDDYPATFVRYTRRN